MPNASSHSDPDSRAVTAKAPITTRLTASPAARARTRVRGGSAPTRLSARGGTWTTSSPLIGRDSTGRLRGLDLLDLLQPQLVEHLSERVLGLVGIGME